MTIERVTPRAVADLFKGLSIEDQTVFFQQLNLTAEGIFLLAGKLSPPERLRFSDMLFEESAWKAFPFLVREAIKVVQENPKATDDELYSLVNEHTSQALVAYEAAFTELGEARYKEQRNRKSDPEIVRRNVEICNLRRQNKKKWTFGKLAKQYKMSRQSIVNILKEEDKWRRESARLSTN